MILNAKQFALQTGFPLETIRRYCRTGILPHWKAGRVYLLDFDKTVKKLALLKENNAPHCWHSEAHVKVNR